VYLHCVLDGAVLVFELGHELWLCSDINVLCVRSMAVINILLRVTFTSGEDKCLIVTNYHLFQIEGIKQGNEEG